MSKKLVVTSDIPFGSAYAYRAGDTIDEDAVKQNKWEDYVASPASKEAKQAQAAGSGEPVTGEDK